MSNLHLLSDSIDTDYHTMANASSLVASWQEYFRSIQDLEPENLAAEVQSQLIEKETPRLFSGRGEIEEWQSSGSDDGSS